VADLAIAVFQIPGYYAAAAVIDWGAVIAFFNLARGA
jgi:hypothetical protein